ncbi:MAG: HAD family hydrolase, partial [Verrucomicrobiaceae bacterium]
MIRAIIFDLDNCLSAADEVGEELLQPVFAAIRNTNQGRIPEEQLAQAFIECWRSPLDVVAEKYEFPADVTAAAWDAYAQVEV